MNRIWVWDLPIRVFHWAFSISIGLALVLALTLDDDNPAFQYHMLFGLTAGFLLAIRLIIGLFGARYSRLRGLFFSPGETGGYMWASLTGRARRYVGHNPGTAVVALGMFGLVIGLTWTGLNMESDGIKEVHELFANLMMAAIVVHILGILLHTYHHRENISLSMIDGKKEGENSAGLPSSQSVAGIVILVVLSLWSMVLVRGHDPIASTVTLPGIGQITLGEAEDDHGRGPSGNVDDEDEDEEDDD